MSGATPLSPLVCRRTPAVAFLELVCQERCWRGGRVGEEDIECGLSCTGATEIILTWGVDSEKGKGLCSCALRTNRER